MNSESFDKKARTSPEQLESFLNETNYIDHQETQKSFTLAAMFMLSIFVLVITFVLYKFVFIQPSITISVSMLIVALVNIIINIYVRNKKAYERPLNRLAITNIGISVIAFLCVIFV